MCIISIGNHAVLAERRKKNRREDCIAIAKIAIRPINDGNCESVERREERYTLSSIRKAVYYEFSRRDEILLFPIQLRPIVYYEFLFSSADGSRIELPGRTRRFEGTKRGRIT